MRRGGEKLHHRIDTMLFPQPLSQYFVLRHGLCDQCPELCGMVEFLGVAELVDNDVVSKLCRQQRDAVIEVDVLFL